VLRAQSVKLQRMLDLEREDRQVAQKAQQEAVRKLREVDEGDAQAQDRDKNRLQELEATAAVLRQQLDKARRKGAPGPDVVEALRKRTVYLEEVNARKEREQLEWQRDMGKKLALTLKVLQLQREQADKVDRVQDSLHRLVSQAAAEAKNARGRTQAAADTVAGVLRRAEVMYSEETRRNRELEQARGLAGEMLKAARDKAGQLRQYEAGMEEELKTGEYERRLHQQLLSEYQAETEPAAGAGGGVVAGQGGVADAISAHWEAMASGRR